MGVGAEVTEGAPVGTLVGVSVGDGTLVGVGVFVGAIVVLGVGETVGPAWASCDPCA